jgi:hypothetical protein
MSPNRKRARIDELQCTRALEGLSPEATEELSSLEEQSFAAPDDYELAAAAVFLALNDFDEEPCPRGLRQQLEQSGLEHL